MENNENYKLEICVECEVRGRVLTDEGHWIAGPSLDRTIRRTESIDYSEHIQGDSEKRTLVVRLSEEELIKLAQLGEEDLKHKLYSLFNEDVDELGWIPPSKAKYPPGSVGSYLDVGKTEIDEEVLDIIRSYKKSEKNRRLN